jgi:hypothetical protein
MRTIPGFLFAWWCFACGDLACRIMNLADTETWVAIWYPVYNTSMLLSNDAQEWADGHGRWWPWER